MASACCYNLLFAGVLSGCEGISTLLFKHSRDGLYCHLCADNGLYDVLVRQELLRKTVTAGNCVYA
jgi:hypothetical protein